MIELIVFDTEVQDDGVDVIVLKRQQSLKRKALNPEESSEEFIKLTGKLSEVFEIWQLRTNFVSLVVVISISSFSYFLINF